MKGAFEYWLTLPKERCELIKAVDDETGQILGLVCWGYRLGQPKPQHQQTQLETEDGKTTTSNAAEASSEDEVAKAEAREQDALARLEAFTSADLDRFMKKVMPEGTRAMYIITISVRPDQHGRGVGSALIQYGTDRADAEGVICWVHASEAGSGMFGGRGFEVDQELEIDLDDWAGQMGVKPPAGKNTWGKYTFRYMIRQPKTL